MVGTIHGRCVVVRRRSSTDSETHAASEANPAAAGEQPAVARNLGPVHDGSVGHARLRITSESVLTALREVGVDYAQGYVISRPAPLAELLGADAQITSHGEAGR
jgi:hypothetical protein